MTEIYLLYRQGDGGQFERLATIGLGAKGIVTVHETKREALERAEKDCRAEVTKEDGPIQT